MTCCLVSSSLEAGLRHLRAVIGGEAAMRANCSWRVEDHRHRSAPSAFGRLSVCGVGIIDQVTSRRRGLQSSNPLSHRERYPALAASSFPD